MKSKSEFHLFSQAVWLAVVLLFIQQLIVASSTIWITRLIAHIQEGSLSLFFLGLYLGSLILPYFPGSAALIEMAKAKTRANVHFINHFTSIYKGQILEWTNSTHHSTKSSILTGEAPQTINGYLDYIYHFASSSLNVVLNLLTLAFIIEPLLLVSYGIGIFFAFLILKFQKSWKKVLALRAQQGRIKWISILLKAWDNVLLNNRYNFQIWEEKADKRGRRLIGSNLKLEGFGQGVSIAMAFVLMVPSFALVCYLAIVRAQDLTWLAMMVVILPRLFQVLNYSYEMLFLLSDFPMQKSRLKTVVKLLEPTQLVDPLKARQQLEKRIQWDKITVATDVNTSLSAKQLLETLPQKGRVTLHGENGSGKTSLLLLIKMLKGESAFYLPSKHDLLFQLSKEKLSTGQSAKKILHELLDHLDNPVVLLDEWDANLDQENVNNLSKLINRLSTDRFVIESRHLKGL